MSSPKVRVGFRPAIWTASGQQPFDVQLRLAERGEELEFDGIFFGDRMLASVGHGQNAVYGSTHTEIFTTLSAIAARTTRIRIGSLVLVVPFRHPVQLAKMVASLDLLADGRLILPVGAGWNEAEFEVLGVNRREAATRMEEGIEIMRLLWGPGRHDHDGPHHSFRDVEVEPGPAQPGGPPIWLGSFSPSRPAIFESGEISAGQDRVLDRVGRLADGWAPLLYSTLVRRGIPPGTLGEAWERVQERAAAAGREGSVRFVYSHWYFVIERPSDEDEARRFLSAFFPGTFEEAKETYLIGSPAEIVDKIGEMTQFIDQIDWFVFTQLGINERQLELLRTDVVPQLASLGKSGPQQTDR